MIRVLRAELVRILGDKDLPRMSNQGYGGASCCFDWNCTEQQRCTNRSQAGGLYGECAGRAQCIYESLAPVCRITDEDCKTDEVRAKSFGARGSPLYRPAIAVAQNPKYNLVDATDEPDESLDDDDRHIFRKGEEDGLATA